MPELPPTGVSTDADLAKTFNSAVVNTTQGASLPASDLTQTFRTPEFQAILESVRHLARLEGVSERDAAERIVRVFRQVDATWKDFVIQEGLAALRDKLGS